MSTYKDNLKYLQADNISSASILSQIENFVTGIFGKLAKTLSKRSPFGIVMHTQHDLQQLNFVYIDNSINENNVYTADNIVSIRSLAALSSFKPLRRISASGIAQLQISSTLIDEIEDNKVFLHNKARLQSSTGVDYFVNMSDEFMLINLLSNTTFTINVVQGIPKQQQFIASGSNDFVIELQNSHIIENNLITVYVNGDLYEKYNVLTDMHSTDKGYLLRDDISGALAIHFGNGYNGVSPAVGADVIVHYVESDGSIGNVNKGELYTIKSGLKLQDESDIEVDLDIYVSIEQLYDMINGYDGDSVDDIRLHIGHNSMSNVIALPEQIKSYLRRYPQFIALNVWSDADSYVINVLLIPNIEYKITAESTYFNLPLSAFEITEDHIINIKAALVADKHNALVTNVNMQSYTISTFAIIALCSFYDVYIDETDIVYKATNAVHTTLLHEYRENAFQISKSKIIKSIISNVDEVESVDVIFVTNDDTILNELGNINTIELDTKVLPIAQPGTYLDETFTNALKILYKTSTNNWQELNNNLT
jgi:hypothetical protein